MLCCLEYWMICWVVYILTMLTGQKLKGTIFIQGYIEAHELRTDFRTNHLFSSVSVTIFLNCALSLVLPISTTVPHEIAKWSAVTCPHCYAMAVIGDDEAKTGYEGVRIVEWRQVSLLGFVRMISRGSKLCFEHSNIVHIQKCHFPFLDYTKWWKNV